MKKHKSLNRADLLRSPASFLALGFGSGLSPVAPGTAGTVVGVVACALLSTVSTSVYIGVTAVIALVGIAICGRAADEMGVHDHGGIVWDEIAGYLITMIAVPISMASLIAGFLLFRLFDIWKPWPIGWLDSHVKGGLGIMVDDILAGAMACLCMHLLLAFFPAIIR